MRQGPGLVCAQHVHASQFLDRDELAHDRLLLRKQAGSDSHRNRQNCRHCYRDRRHGQHQGKLKRREDRIAAVDPDGDDQRNHGYRQHDQVVADLQHRLLEMTHGNRRLHQLRGLAKIGVFAGRIDQRADLAATNDRTRKYGIAGFARGG